MNEKIDTPEKDVQDQSTQVQSPDPKDKEQKDSKGQKPTPAKKGKKGSKNPKSTKKEEKGSTDQNSDQKDQSCVHDPNLLKFKAAAKAYKKNYPDEVEFHFASDTMVFLGSNHADAVAHQNTLKGELVTIKAE